MQRLCNATLPDFLDANANAAVLIGAPVGEATMDAAHAFAEAWADRRDQAGFGYVDAFADPAVARAFAVRVLPTTLIFRDGRVAERLEGRCSSYEIGAALAPRPARSRRREQVAATGARFFEAAPA